jgi:hypothetical protein
MKKYLSQVILLLIIDIFAIALTISDFGVFSMVCTIGIIAATVLFFVDLNKHIKSTKQ